MEGVKSKSHETPGAAHQMNLDEAALFLAATLGAFDKVALGTSGLYVLREDLNRKAKNFLERGRFSPLAHVDLARECTTRTISDHL
ncbi:conserved hypothetical protein [Histoplasma capsulatum var. duboisii H88]|uniref:Uncharacterized protein n=2 Tax=Ajellomyces capsulatus TaxID=5037 RepID=F0UQG2_AJEC8|nr:predicted protein [Histoplasma capsulatum H143]EGC47952.1 conserved hypothetical protein [Histoplasma capsulatum var. duboisii H88]